MDQIELETKKEYVTHIYTHTHTLTHTCEQWCGGVSGDDTWVGTNGVLSWCRFQSSISDQTHDL